MTQRFCRVCKGWHSLDVEWPEECLNHYRPKGNPSGQVIKDIEPYKPIAADIDGKRRPIGSRREHREFLKRNGYIEVGNEKQSPKPQPIETVSGRDIRQTMEQLRSRK